MYKSNLISGRQSMKIDCLRIIDESINLLREESSHNYNRSDTLQSQILILSMVRNKITNLDRYMDPDRIVEEDDGEPD